MRFGSSSNTHYGQPSETKNVRSAFSNIDNGACFSLKIAGNYDYNMNN